MRRVVVTGIGIISPLGVLVVDVIRGMRSWSLVKAGANGRIYQVSIRPTMPCQVAGEVPRIDGRCGGGPDVPGSFDPAHIMSPKEQKPGG